MARHKKARKTLQGATGTTRPVRRENSHRWPSKYFTSHLCSNRGPNSPSREISVEVSSARGSQPSASLRQSQKISPESRSNSESVQQSHDQSFNPCEAQQTEKHTAVASLGPVSERRFLLQNFAPHSCISPTTCRQHPVYNSENIDPVPSQWYRITPQCFEPYCRPVSLAPS